MSQIHDDLWIHNPMAKTFPRTPYRNRFAGGAYPTAYDSASLAVSAYMSATEPFKP
jgi:hypothetical protein